MCVQSLLFRFEMLRFQGRLDEADPLFERSLAIREKVLGPDHSDVAQSLNNQALLLQARVRAVMAFQDICCGARWIWFVGAREQGGAVLPRPQVRATRRSGTFIMLDVAGSPC